MNIKDLFLLAVSVSLLCLCLAGGYFLWEHEKERRERAAAHKAEIDIEASKKHKLKKKRERLRKYYASEFGAAFHFWLDPSKKDFEKKPWSQEIERIYANMLKDGFDGAEIDELYGPACLRAGQYWEEQAKK